MNLRAVILFILLAAGSAAWAQEGNNAEIRFEAFDIFVDSQGQPLAAYQLEVTNGRGNARIAGIEGGEHAAFNNPPYHDPKAMRKDHVILAAFTTAPAGDLPVGRTRVATIHVMVNGRVEPRFAVKLVTAGGPAAKKISAQASIEKRKAP